MMSIPKRLAVVLAVVLGLGMSAAAGAEITWNYVEIDYANVDVDFSETIVDEEVEARVSTDGDTGYRFGGAWQFYENWHVFGEYGNAENDIKFEAISDELTESVSGKFDVTRWRVGVGYGFPVNPELNLYGRISYDSIEFDDFEISGLDEDLGNTDDDGIGAEAGGRWAVAEPFELQGYVRYTPVGEVDVEADDEFDSDFLVGVAGRYYFNEVIGVQAGYEFGEIDTWNLSARLRF